MKKIILLLFLCLSIYFVTSCSYLNLQIKEKTIKNQNNNIRYPKITLKKQPKLQDKINRQIYEVALAGKKDLKKYKPETYDYLSQYSVTYRKGPLISILFQSSLTFPKLAHPINTLNSLTFNLLSGNHYQLKNIFSFFSNYEKKINKILTEKLKGKNLLQKFTGITKNQTYYLTHDGLVIYFQEYIYTPHVQGPLTILIPYSKIKNTIKKEFLP